MTAGVCRPGAVLAALGIVMLAAGVGARSPHPQTTTPLAVAEQLLAADRAFSSAAAATSLVDALAAMFRDDVTMVVPGGFADGKTAAVTALRGHADNLTSRAEWAPLGGGISADAMHGFTYGHMTIQPQGGAVRHAKYMAYWIRSGGAWRIAVYKRAPAPDRGPMTMMRPSLPAALVAASADAARVDAYRTSLQAAERTFSDVAQKIGLGPAFTKYGHDEAVNMGGPDQPGYTIGAAAIGKAIGAGSSGASPVSWSADRAIVASSGDLGITLGFIRPNDPGASRPPTPFFTIWRRASPSDPWRYIAE